MDLPIDNNRFMRVLVTVSAFVTAYVVAWLILIVMVSDASAKVLVAMPWLVAAGAAWMAWRSGAEQLPSRSSRMLAGGAIGAFVGFLTGFAGPLVLAPQANQGPMLGLFITAPAGALIGCLGAWWWYR